MKKVPSGNKGLAKLPTAVRNKMGYMMHGGEKMLTSMPSIDMSEPMVMRMGGGTHNTYSGPKKKNK
jgi:hypothetical protein|tara:strand:+ start:277 stop:474 length:198 start_codon:yes stop_codon:yes gene_type:complete